VLLTHTRKTAMSAGGGGDVGSSLELKGLMEQIRQLEARTGEQQELLQAMEGDLAAQVWSFLCL
jgi:hypothetical protein